MAHILIVDDDDLVAESLSDILTDEGHQISLALNGKQALEVLPGLRPDMVLTDIRMPVMDGRALARALKGDNRFCEMPVLVVSSHFLSDAELTEIGARALVMKPWTTTALLQAVNRHLERATA